jgi:hypothetical protein
MQPLNTPGIYAPISTHTHIHPGQITKPATQNTELVAFKGLFSYKKSDFLKANPEILKAYNDLKSSHFDDKEALTTFLNGLDQAVKKHQITDNERSALIQTLESKVVKDCYKFAPEDRIDALVKLDALSTVVFDRVFNNPRPEFLQKIFGSGTFERSGELIRKAMNSDDRQVRKEAIRQIKSVVYSLLIPTCYSTDSKINTFKMMKQLELFQDSYDVRIIAEQLREVPFGDQSSIVKIAAAQMLPDALGQLARQNIIDKEKLNDLARDCIKYLQEAPSTTPYTNDTLIEACRDSITKIIYHPDLPGTPKISFTG